METWLSSYLSSYRKAYGENATSLAIKRMGKVFRELELEHPRAEIAQRFLNYCRGTELRYYSAERFAVVFPAWRDAPVATAAVCVHHADRPAVATLSRNPLCRECFDAT